MSLSNINIIGYKCCGCEACYAVCPRDAIYSLRGARGELVYKAGDLCINCGKCLSVCAAKSAKTYEATDVFFRGITKQKDVLKKSSSGGIAFEMARKILTYGDIIYAAVWDVDKQMVRHSRITSLRELPSMQGSKYVHSTIEKETYVSILEDAKTHKVLCIGCPCQVSAVKNIVGDNDNLICIDLVCHGVPSAEMLEEQLRILTKKPIKMLSFRHGLDFTLDIEDSSGKVYSVKGYDNPYYSLFLSFSSLRESCYSCSYANRKRVGDLTIGDYTEDGTGYSCVIPNSDIGKQLIKETVSIIDYKKRNACLLLENDALNHPTYRNAKMKDFTDRYNKYGLYFAYYRTFYIFVIKRVCRRILGDKLYDKFLKRIKKK